MVIRSKSRGKFERTCPKCGTSFIRNYKTSYCSKCNVARVAAYKKTRKYIIQSVYGILTKRKSYLGTVFNFTREELEEWLSESSDFNAAYNIWKASGYSKGSSMRYAVINTNGVIGLDDVEVYNLGRRKGIVRETKMARLSDLDRPVRVYNEKGVYTETYESIRKCASDINIEGALILMASKKLCSINGRFFRFLREAKGRGNISIPTYNDALPL